MLTLSDATMKATPRELAFQSLLLDLLALQTPETRQELLRRVDQLIEQTPPPSNPARLGEHERFMAAANIQRDLILKAGFGD